MPNKNSTTITNGIKIHVEPDFVQEEYSNEGKKNLFSYRVEITNVGDEWAKLVYRHWIIINAEGHTEEVRGAGVVGYTPELNPGASFTYTSYCPLDTEWGTMEGYFEMVNKNGDTFQAKIDRFYLVSSNLIEG
jgi:ApaG protein